MLSISITEISILISWILFACGCGLLEGFIFGFKYRVKSTYVTDSEFVKKFNFHLWFTIFRSVVAFGFILAYLCNMYAIDVDKALLLIKGFLMSLVLIFTFTYFHDGTYYCTRDNIVKGTYPLRWKAQTTTSDAKINMDYARRTECLLFGLFLFVINFIMLFLLAHQKPIV